MSLIDDGNMVVKTIRTSQMDGFDVFTMIMAILHEPELLSKENRANNVKCIPDKLSGSHHNETDPSRLTFRAINQSQKALLDLRILPHGL